MHPYKPCRECGAERNPWDVVRGGGVRCAVCRTRAAVTAPQAVVQRGGVSRNFEREARCIQLYQHGYTLQAIGDVYSLSRERIRQILKRAGVCRTDGGIAKQAESGRLARAAKKLAEWDRRRMAMFGCDSATFVALNGGVNSYRISSPAKQYVNQMRAAQKRGIGWELSFLQWCQIWDESGRYGERGRWADSYVMARLNDFGLYAVWNVYITTLSQNVADYQSELKRRGVRCADGYKRLPEQARAAA